MTAPPPINIVTMNTISPFQIFLQKKSQEFIKANDKEALIAAEGRDKDLMDRIENFRREKMTEEERGMNTADTILEAFKTNTIIRAALRKDLVRQTIHEKAQIEWIQAHQYEDAVKMSAGVNGTCLSKHKFHVISKVNPRPSDATKTFDVYVPSKKMFLVLKYTSVPGGSQDNQFADVKHFLHQAVGYLTENMKAEETFGAYLDGAYYTPKKKKELQDMIPDVLTQRILITNCESIHPKTPLT